MKCKRCKREVQKDFNLCPYCGYRLVPDATEIRVPEPKRKADGSFSQQVMYNGKRYTVSAPTLDEYKAKARQIKLGNIPEKEDDEFHFVPLEDILEAYLSKKDGVIQDSTMSFYRIAMDNPLADVRLCSPEAIDWQRLVDHLSKRYSAVYLSHVWNMVSNALEQAGYPVPDVQLPKTPRSNRPFLDDDEIPKLLDAARGSKYELGIILALHSLRAQEVCALDAEDIHDGFIHVNKCMMFNGSEYVLVNRTKTETSTREIPVLIDRLYEVVPQSGRACPYRPDAFTAAVRRLCVTAGITRCTAHDLRRSFASLAYSLNVPERRIMRYGGWSNPSIMYDVYVKLYDKNSQKDAEPLRKYFNITSNPQDTQ